MRPHLFAGLSIAVVLPFFIFLLTPGVSSAIQLVPQCAADCQACHLVQLGQNIINFLVTVGVLIAVLVFALAGMKMVMAAGSAESVSSAKSMMTSAVIGFIIVLAAWLVVDTVMKLLYEGSALDSGTRSAFGPWNQIKCVELPVVSTALPPGGVAPGGSGGGVLSSKYYNGTPGCPTCTPVPSSVMQCGANANCSVDAAYAENLDQLSGFGLTMTEGYPPRGTHQAACHYSGACTDVKFTNGDYSVSNIQAFQQAAEAAGYTAVYEPAQGLSCPSGVSCLDYSKTKSTGTHFSLYKKKD